jgi:ABC-type branched-subunit amino acid transport system substrate-binding protein
MLRLSHLGRAALAAAALALAPPACSLGNVNRAACEDDAACESAFGVGSTCGDGYCSEPATCSTGHDCRMKHGGGACVAGTCRMFLPEHPQCTLVDPPDLHERPLAGDGATFVIGAIFATDDERNIATADAVILAAREIDQSTGLADGQRVGVVVCDNGGPGNQAQGEERTQLDHGALDYLAGTLGVPFLVGPRASSDSLKIIARLLEKEYPTVVISPSATSIELTGVPSRLDPGDPNPLFWRTCPTDAIQVQVLAQNVLAADLAITSATVVYTNDSYGQGFSDLLLNAFPNTNLVPFDAAKLAEGAADAAATLTATYNADAVVIVSTFSSQTVALLDAMAAHGLSGKKFFLTDGSKDASKLLAADVPPAVKEILKTVKGTGPASARDDATFKTFSAGFGAEFPGFDPSQFAFLAHAYDATYLGALAVIDASKVPEYDGRQVAAGLAKLSAGTPIEIGPVSWTSAKDTLATDGQIDVLGISGNLNLDPTLGEGPAPIEVWVVSPDGTTFVTEAIF